jgi:hypothetical protein
MLKNILITLGILAVLLFTLAALYSGEIHTVPNNTVDKTKTGVKMPVTDDTIVLKGSRSLAIDVNTEGGKNFDRDFALAQDVGIDRIGLFLAWSVIEPTSGRYDSEWLDIADAYYAAAGVMLDLTIAPVNTTKWEFPSDLVGMSFDDRKVIERFKSVVEFALGRLKKVRVATINIGSEADALFGDDVEQWDSYGRFYREVSAYMRAKYPNILIATEQTFDGVIGASRERVRSVNGASDIIGVSYYGVSSDGTVKRPADVRSDMGRIIELYPDKPIYFFQYGYPSSELLGSSEYLQAEFIIESFRVWDAYADQVRLIDFTWLNDTTSDSAKEIGRYYGASGDYFTEFIRTLGLRATDGREKPAFHALQREARARGWR